MAELHQLIQFLQGATAVYGFCGESSSLLQIPGLVSGDDGSGGIHQHHISVRARGPRQDPSH